MGVQAWRLEKARQPTVGWMSSLSDVSIPNWSCVVRHCPKLPQTAIVNEAAVDGKASQIFLPLVQQHGRNALQVTLAGVGGRLPRSNLSYLAELLLAFSKRLPNETRAWLKELFAQVSVLSYGDAGVEDVPHTLVSGRACNRLLNLAIPSSPSPAPQEGFPSTRVSQEVKDRYAKSILRWVLRSARLGLRGGRMGGRTGSLCMCVQDVSH